MNKSKAIHRVVKFRLDNYALTENQITCLQRSAGTVRVAYNWALNRHNDREDQLYQWMIEQVKNDSSVDEEKAKELLKDKQLRQKLRKSAPKELTNIPSAFALKKMFEEESRKEDCYFHWYTSEKHGVNKPYVVTSAMEAFYNAVQRYLNDTNGCRTNIKGKKSRKDGRPHGWPRFIKKGDGRDGFTIQNIAPSSMGPKEQEKRLQQGLPPKTWEDHKDVWWRVVPDAHHIKIPSFGNLRVHQNTKQLRRMINRGGWPKSARFSNSGGYWYVSIVVHFQPAIPDDHNISPSGAIVSMKPDKNQRASGTVGVDLGVKELAVLSTGDDIPNPRLSKNAEKKVKRLQRKLQRQQSPKGQPQSEGYKKTKQQLARLQHKISLQRKSYVHGLTKKLATDAETVAIEDLNVRGMTSSVPAKPDPDREGHYLANGKAAKSGLNRAILDVGFGEFRRQLQYKTPMYGSSLVAVPMYAPTSKMCSNCGKVKDSLKLSERVYRCSSCGFEVDRDLNASINIKRLAEEAKNM